MFLRYKMGSDNKTGLNDASGIICSEPLVWFFFMFFFKKNSNDAFYFLSMF